MADSTEIKDVWDYNLDQEFHQIRQIVDNYSFVAMDTEFPGAPVSLPPEFRYDNNKTYEQLEANVNTTKLIQLGLTFGDKHGNLAARVENVDQIVQRCIWQFNFKEFDENTDTKVDSSITMLKKAGIDFEKNKEMGIDVKRFGELLMSSGVVLNDEICWVTFHGGSDFGYLLKLLTQKELPKSRENFFELIKVFFPTVYDVKHLTKTTPNGMYGLKKLAERLEVARFGAAHQAGSDSLLTYRCFLKIKEMYFAGESLRSYADVIFGLNDA